MTATMGKVWNSAAPINPDVVEAPRSPWWHALLVPPNREVKSREWLERFMPEVYLPQYSKVVRGLRGRQSGRRLCAALPGMLFAPLEALDIPRRREVFDHARVRGFMRSSDGLPQIIHLRDINKIKLLERKLNLPPEAKGTFFRVGQRVQFVDGLFDAWQGTVFEIASESRIGVEVDHLFGRKTKVYVPASEIEAL